MPLLSNWCESYPPLCRTRDVLHKLESINFPGGALLVGIYFESLDTSIPHECGLRWVMHFFEQKFPELGAHNEFVVETLGFMLIISESWGLTISNSGVPWWVPLGLPPMLAYIWACGRKRWFSFLFCTSAIVVCGWGTLIFWCFGGALVNNCQNIRLTHSFHHQRLLFLDLTIEALRGRISTRTYRKDTPANTLLQATSHHPQSLICGIPMGQFLRIKQIVQ